MINASLAMQDEAAPVDARIQAAVRQEVDAAVERLRKEFAKRESMLMAAVMSHAERERDLVHRMHALEKRLDGNSFAKPEA